MHALKCPCSDWAHFVSERSTSGKVLLYCRIGIVIVYFCTDWLGSHPWIPVAHPKHCSVAKHYISHLFSGRGNPKQAGWQYLQSWHSRQGRHHCCKYGFSGRHCLAQKPLTKSCLWLWQFCTPSATQAEILRRSRNCWTLSSLAVDQQGRQKGNVCLREQPHFSCSSLLVQNICDALIPSFPAGWNNATSSSSSKMAWHQ